MSNDLEKAAAIHPEMAALLDSIRKNREFYGLPPEPLQMPTLSEVKAWERGAVERLIAATVEEHGRRRDGDNWFTPWMESQIHNRELPYFAEETVRMDCWDTEEEMDLVCHAWTLPEWPGQYGVRLWRPLFTKIGFVCDDEDCIYHPDGKSIGMLTCYRGSFAQFKRGLSWTLDKERAEWFAKRGDMAGKGRTMRIWRCEIPANRQFAHLHGRMEDEVVADVRSLKIESEDA